MTKKHYNMIAAVLKENKADYKLTLDLAIQLSRGNSLFDIDRFMKASGHSKPLPL
jgi:hypothetical protein